VGSQPPSGRPEQTEGESGETHGVFVELSELQKQRSSFLRCLRTRRKRLLK
jgi:hypothetical protein